ncbi:MAG: hypothetical protein IT374_27065 [Polyangiaceae bacterium]|nr:hypothetical protein [Polyangiaceae bacterium]
MRSRTLRRRVRAATLLSAAGAVALSPREGVAAEAYTGADFTTLARQSIDLMRMQHYRLQGQMAIDRSQFFAESTGRFMKARVRLNDGTELDAVLERLGGGYWWGGGRPRTGFAWFSAFQSDVGVATTAHKAADAVIYDGLLFAGVAYHGLTVGAGVRGGFTSGMDANGEFTLRSNTGASAASPRAGAPGDALLPTLGRERVDRFRFGGVVTTVEHVEGLSLGAVLDGSVASSPLAAVRALAQPEPLLRRAGLRALGVPSLGVDRVAPGIDYYSDAFEAGKKAAAQGLPRPALPAKALWEVPFVVDDLASVGLRVRAVTQIAPTTQFRLAELGWSQRDHVVRAGGRGVGFRRGDALVAGGEVFVGAGTSSPDHQDFAITLSYSYNVPDSVTFFPIPNAQVWGFQATFGPRQLGRPLVPRRTPPSASSEEVSK